MLDPTLTQFSKALSTLLSDSLAKDITIATQAAEILALKKQLTPLVLLWTNLASSSAWIQPLNVGDTGGDNTQKAGVGLLSPGEPLLYRFTPGHPFNNAYVYLELEKLLMASGKLITPQQLTTLTNFRMSLTLSLPAEHNVWQALEFELQYASGGWVYNMAWQLLPSGILRVFDYINKAWVDSGLKNDVVGLNSGAPLPFVADFIVNRNQKKESHTRLAVAGVVLQPAFTQPAQSGSGEYLHIAFQLDTDGSMHPYSLAVGGVEVVVS